MVDSGSDISTPLSVWDQGTSRLHIRLVHCFKVDNNDRQQVEEQLGKLVLDLSKSRPDFAGRLHLGDRPGWVYLRTSPGFRIPLEVVDIEEDFGCTYQKLKESKFPAKEFVHPRFGYRGAIEAGKPPVPVAAVKAFFIDGGLLLATFLHHAFGDGWCLKDFIESLAAVSRGEEVGPYGTRSLDFVKANGGAMIGESGKVGAKGAKEDVYDKLIQTCPEYKKMADGGGPNQPRLLDGGPHLTNYAKDGRIFVFKTSNIQSLRERTAKHLRGKLPSAYVCIAALVWAHAAKARIQTEEKHKGEWYDVRKAVMSNPVDWRRRAFREECKAYYGNAIALAQTEVPIKTLRDACDHGDAFVEVVRALKASIERVDEEFVRMRVAMLDAWPDLYELGLNMDQRVPQDLSFNTWRDFGADAEWDLYGVDAEVNIRRSPVKADALRRSQDEWNMGGTLILPARQASDEYEVLLTIPKEAMEALCNDKVFRDLCPDVIV